jgi:hypothetical protein
MFEQMADYVTRNNLISPFQSGLRPGHSTKTALVRVSDDISLNMELNRPKILVCHVLFILKLRQRYGFHTSATALPVSSYFFPYLRLVVLKALQFHMFADDLQIYHSRPRNLLSESIREVNSDIRKIFEWSRANHLTLNPTKSMVLPIYCGHLLDPLPPLFLGEDFIPCVYKAKNMVLLLTMI